MGQLNRITQQPDVMGGKACIRGMRVTPYLEREDIMQALRNAAWRPEEREGILPTV
jgi:uncharacterized protein (DUF433 family)